jgi:hypothetical protein
MSIFLALTLLVCQIEQQGPSAPIHESPNGMNGTKQYER